jgi:hypothetical protein
VIAGKKNCCSPVVAPLICSPFWMDATLRFPNLPIQLRPSWIELQLHLRLRLRLQNAGPSIISTDFANYGYFEKCQRFGPVHPRAALLTKTSASLLEPSILEQHRDALLASIHTWRRCRALQHRHRLLLDLELQLQQ